MASATLIRLNKDEWQKLPAGHFYNGKYQIGPFTLTYEFIVKYMTLIHKTEIPESWLTDNGTSLDERRVLYMEASDILTKDIVREIQKTVKSPQDQLQVYRRNDQIITLEMMEKYDAKNSQTFDQNSYNFSGISVCSACCSWCPYITSEP